MKKTCYLCWWVVCQSRCKWNGEMEKGGMEKNNKRNHDEKDTMSVKQCKPGIIIPKID